MADVLDPSPNFLRLQMCVSKETAIDLWKHHSAFFFRELKTASAIELAAFGSWYILCRDGEHMWAAGALILAAAILVVLGFLLIRHSEYISHFRILAKDFLPPEPQGWAKGRKGRILGVATPFVLAVANVVVVLVTFLGNAPDQRAVTASVPSVPASSAASQQPTVTRSDNRPVLQYVPWIASGILAVIALIQFGMTISVRNRELRISQAKAAHEMLDEMFDDEPCRALLEGIDYEGASNIDKVKKALEAFNTDGSLGKLPKQLRDLVYQLDCLFYRFDRFERSIRAKIILKDDIVTPTGGYIKVLAGAKSEILTYVNKACSTYKATILPFLGRFSEWSGEEE